MDVLGHGRFSWVVRGVWSLFLAGDTKGGMNMKGRSSMMIEHTVLLGK